MVSKRSRHYKEKLNTDHTLYANGLNVFNKVLGVIFSDVRSYVKVKMIRVGEHGAHKKIKLKLQ
jgi:hypothetical protein